MLQRLRGYHWWNEWGEFQEYQTQLIDSVKEDIKRLHDRVGFIAGCKRLPARRDSGVTQVQNIRCVPRVPNARLHREIDEILRKPDKALKYI